MSWYKKSIRMREFSVAKALEILGLEPGATERDIKSARNNLAKKYHTDKGADNHEKMSEVNVAFEFLKERDFDTSVASEPSFEFSEPSRPTWDENGRRKSWQEEEEERVHNRGIPAWQTDYRSSYNKVGTNFCDLNYCKFKVHEKAIKHGKVERYHIWAFDGSFFRGVFEVFANESALDLAGEAMYIWNSKCSNSYRTVAVFASTSNSRTIKLINLRGHPVSGKEYTHESFNNNPGNDSSFVNELRKEFGDKE